MIALRFILSKKGSLDSYLAFFLFLLDEFIRSCDSSAPRRGLWLVSSRGLGLDGRGAGGLGSLLFCGHPPLSCPLAADWLFVKPESAFPLVCFAFFGEAEFPSASGSGLRSHSMRTPRKRSLTNFSYGAPFIVSLRFRHDVL